MSLKNKMLAVGCAVAFSLPFASYADSLITANVKNSTNLLIKFQYEDSQCAYNYERKTFIISPGETMKMVFNSDEGGRCSSSYYARGATYLVYRFSTVGGKGVMRINVNNHTNVHFAQYGLSNVTTETKTIEGIPTYIIYAG